MVAHRVVALAALAALSFAATGADCEPTPAPNTPGGLCNSTVEPACPYPSCPSVDGKQLCVKELSTGAACDKEDVAGGVCAPGLLCGESGVCGGAGLLERCGDNGVVCADGGKCVTPVGERGRQPLSVCYKSVGEGQQCELEILREGDVGFRAACEDGLDCLLPKGDGLSPTCGKSPSPSPSAKAFFGKSCENLACAFDYCNPDSKTCTDFPAPGEACAAPELAATNGRRCALYSALGDTYCAEDEMCQLVMKDGDECDIENPKCATNRDCVERIDGSGTSCAVAVGLGHLCGDARNETCWQQGLSSKSIPIGWTQYLTCAAGVCAENKPGGIGSLCGDDENACVQTGSTCAQDQAGEKRCLNVANLEESDAQECYRGVSYDEIALFSCPADYTCEKAKTLFSSSDYSVEFCYSNNLAGDGEACDSYGGGIKCKSGLRCGRVDSLSSSEICVSAAEEGGSCGGDSFAECRPAFPSTGSCEKNICIIDSSRSTPCEEGQETIQVLDPNDRARMADVCVDYQQEKGERCEVSAPPLAGAIFIAFKCKEGLECRQPESVSRFDVSGTCSAIASDGERCAPDENVVCVKGFACMNGSCQKLPSKR